MSCDERKRIVPIIMCVCVGLKHGLLCQGFGEAKADGEASICRGYHNAKKKLKYAQTICTVTEFLVSPAYKLPS